MGFEGYTEEALAFLAELPTRNPDWLKANRSAYETLIVEPTKALVVGLGDELRSWRPEIVAEPKTNGSIAPINNDRRFAPDRPPYKDHLLLRFWEGTPKKTAPTLFVRIALDGVGFASGVVPADIDRWREVIAGSPGEQVAAAVADLATARDAEIAGQELESVPAPYPAHHQRAELLRHKMLQVRWAEPVPAAIHSAGFVDWAARRLDACLPLHEALVACTNGGSDGSG